MRDDERVFLIGEDVGHFGGPFGVSKGLLEEFGAERVIDTPIAEEGFVGAAFGAAWMGERPIAELQFADFISCAFDSDRDRRRQDALAQRHQAARRDPRAVRRRRARRALPRELPRGLLRRHGRASRSSARAASRMPTACCAARSRTTTRCSTSSTRRSTAACAPRRRRRPLRTPIGRAQIARAGTDVTVIAYGAMVDVGAARRRGARGRGLRRGARPAHRVAARRATPSWSRSRAPRACACCRRRARRSAPPGRCSR